LNGAPAASLPMYDWPEVQWAHDALWAAIRDRLRAEGVEAPDGLDRTRPSEEVWLDPALLLSQTCGWPFATRLIDRVSLVGTPEYDVEGCRGPLYSSFIVVRREEGSRAPSEFRHRRIAINGQDSLSGFVAFKPALDLGADVASPLDLVQTGSHRASVRAVAKGEADIASIDAVCWALAQTHEMDAASELKIIGNTAFRPGLPLIAAQACTSSELDLLREAIAEALAADETEAARRALRLSGFSTVGRADYEVIAMCAGIDTPAPAMLPADANDEQVFSVVRDWCEKLAAEDYSGAFFMTEHKFDMTPWQLKAEIEDYWWEQPSADNPVHKVTSPVTAQIRSGEENILPSNRWGIDWSEKPLPHAPRYLGYIHYDLPLNGFWSKLTAEFDLNMRSNGIVLELESVHVM
jgi:hypothetical protein